VKKSVPMKPSIAVIAATAWFAALSFGAARAAPDASKTAPSSMLPGTSSHEPINIDAGKLDYYDKEQKLVYSGGVVAVQGDSTLKGSELTIYLLKDASKPGAAKTGKGEVAAAATTAAGQAGGDPSAPGSSSVKHMDVKGPVTLISKDQVGTGDNGSYDKAENKVTLTGNVTLSQGTNVTKGDRLVYDLTSGQAQVFSGQTYGRVRSVFTPGSGTPEQAGAAGKKKPQPRSSGGTASAQ
jgi:lipopolysaccharide export system protein LptA